MNTGDFYSEFNMYYNIQKCPVKTLELHSVRIFAIFENIKHNKQKSAQQTCLIRNLIANYIENLK